MSSSFEVARLQRIAQLSRVEHFLSTEIAFITHETPERGVKNVRLQHIRNTVVFLTSLAIALSMPLLGCGEEPEWEKPGWAAKTADQKQWFSATLVSKCEQPKGCAEQLIELLEDRDVRAQTLFDIGRLGPEGRTKRVERTLVSVIREELDDGLLDPEETHPMVTKADTPCEIISVLGSPLFNAAFALGNIQAQSRQSLRVLTSLLETPNARLRQIASYALKKNSNPRRERIDVLRNRLSAETDDDVRAFMRECIASLEASG